MTQASPFLFDVNQILGKTPRKQVILKAAYSESGSILALGQLDHQPLKPVRHFDLA